MDTTQSVTERLRALAKEARSLASRDARLFLRLGAIACEAQDLLAVSGEPKAFRRWILDSRIPQSVAYKAMAAHRLLGDAPGAAQQPRTVLELLGGSQAAADEARPLLTRRLTVREAQAIVRRHKPAAKPAAQAMTRVQTFETSVGRLALTFDGDPTHLARALAEAFKQQQPQPAPTPAAPESPLQASRTLLDRISGRAA